MKEPKESFKEEFAKKFMVEEGIKGKATRIKIMRLIDIVGYNKKKIKTALLKSNIMDRITD
ncbi:MAG: hypothetical protein ACFFFB_08675 [Candidatus Heimdallarchaeota archaeon]